MATKVYRSARSCTRREVERANAGRDLVPVIFEPQGVVDMVPRQAVELVKRVRQLTPQQRAEFDRVLATMRGAA